MYVCVEAEDNLRCCSEAIILVLRESLIYLKSAIGSGWMISELVSCLMSLISLAIGLQAQVSISTGRHARHSYVVPGD